MAEPRDPQPQQTVAESLPEKVMAQLTEIAALLSLTAGEYKEQAHLTKQTARAEMALSRRSLMLAAGLLVALGAGVIMFWGSVLAFAGYLLYQATASVFLTAVLLFVLQVVMLYWCLRNMRYALKQIGFSNTLAQLKDILRFSAEPAGGDNVN
jgi:Flp pilus assembly protein TadB